MAKNHKKKSFSAKVLDSQENTELWKILKSQFGIDTKEFENQFGFAENKKGRLWFATKVALQFVEDETLDPAKVLTNAIGKRVFEKETREFFGIRLTLDGVLVFEKYITKNCIKLKIEEEINWYAGQSLIRKELNDGIYVLISSENLDLIGCTVSYNGKLLNFQPKWRRFPRQ